MDGRAETCLAPDATGLFLVGVKGKDVLQALGLVAVRNINIVDLHGCSLISVQHMAWTVARVREKCQGATEINIEGCRDWAILRAVANALRRRNFG